MTGLSGSKTMVAAIGLAAVLAASAVRAESQGVTVVELFTSQGCNSCPPANANLVKLMDDNQLLLLSFSVTYWDRLGWKDSFGNDAYTNRQYDYVNGLGLANAFTPQMVINGRLSTVGNQYSQLQKLIAQAGRVESSPIKLAADRVTIEPKLTGSEASSADVWLVRYEPGVLAVAVTAGENSGVTLPHGRVVREMVKLGQWQAGKGFSQTLPASPNPSWRNAVLLQGGRGGVILAAATKE
ncbi:MAG: DUF1223 domain-containing protein [Candidatus Pacebacteria bacterium]|nr:DUF1223 domain-containing protein [Candidatus Paceibacterota bacterium]